MAKAPTPEQIADTLTGKERVILCGAALDIDHVAPGITASAMQLMEVRGVIERESGRYVLTETGRAVFRVLLKSRAVLTSPPPDPALRADLERHGRQAAFAADDFHAPGGVQTGVAVRQRCHHALGEGDCLVVISEHRRGKPFGAGPVANLESVVGHG
jgi:hypothetical protein